MRKKNMTRVHLLLNLNGTQTLFAAWNSKQSFLNTLSGHNAWVGLRVASHKNTACPDGWNLETYIGTPDKVSLIQLHHKLNFHMIGLLDKNLLADSAVCIQCSIFLHTNAWVHKTVAWQKTYRATNRTTMHLTETNTVQDIPHTGRHIENRTGQITEILTWIVTHQPYSTTYCAQNNSC